MSETRLEDLALSIKPRAASSLMFWGIVGFVVIFFLWAAFAELDRTVRALGRVIPSSELQIVSTLNPGIVDRIFVRGGQKVARGDPLLLLDPTQSSGELGSGVTTLAALQVRAARLDAEIVGRKPVFPTALDEAMQSQVRVETALFNARASELAGLTAAARARIAQARQAVAEARGSYTAQLANRDARQAEVRILKSLVERGVEPRISLIQAEGAAATAVGEAAAAAAVIGRADAAVAEAQANLSQTTADWRARAATELAITQADYAARRRAIPALAEQVERTTVRAPLAGIVNRVLITTRGSSVMASQPLVEIVPSDRRKLIEVRVRPQDIASVRMGQSARVAITAYDRTAYGTLPARVVQISADAIDDERTGEPFYLVRLRTNANALRDREGSALPIGPGMIAEADLLGDRRTVLQYIFSPLTRISQRAFRE